MFLWQVIEVEQLFIYLWTKDIKYFAHFSTGLSIDWACRWSLCIPESSLLLFVLLILFSNTSWLAFYFLRIFQCNMVPDFNVVLCMDFSFNGLLSIVSWSCFLMSLFESFIVLFSTLKSVTRSSFLCMGWERSQLLFYSRWISVDPGFSVQCNAYFVIKKGPIYALVCFCLLFCRKSWFSVGVSFTILCPALCISTKIWNQLVNFLKINYSWDFEWNFVCRSIWEKWKFCNIDYSNL